MNKEKIDTFLTKMFIPKSLPDFYYACFLNLILICLFTPINKIYGVLIFLRLVLISYTSFINDEHKINFLTELKLFCIRKGKINFNFIFLIVLLPLLISGMLIGSNHIKFKETNYSIEYFHTYFQETVNKNMYEYNTVDSEKISLYEQTYTQGIYIIILNILFLIAETGIFLSIIFLYKSSLISFLSIFYIVYLILKMLFFIGRILYQHVFIEKIEFFARR